MASRRVAGGSATADRAVPPRALRHELHAAVERLVDDYREWIPVGSIVRCVARSWETVHAGRQSPSDPVAVVEALARTRLERRLSTGTWSIALRDAPPAPRRPSA